MELNRYSFVGIFLWLLLGCSLSYATVQDVACLRSIKDSLEDPFNYLNSSWNFNDDTEGFICKFAGVECWHPDENKVLNLRLSDMGLRGKFPLGIKDCSSLTGLNLSNNHLYGVLPENISHLVGFITALDLSSNNFSGNIPKNLANCTYLNILKLDRNMFTGPIPAVLGQLGRLKTFSVAYNRLSGPIPTFTGNYNASADDFAGNPELCGAPLKACQTPPNGPRT